MKFIYRFIWGPNVNPDEVQKQALDIMNTKILAFSFSLNIIILFISFFWDIFHHTLSFQTLLIAAMLLIVSGYVMFLSYKRNGRFATSTEAYSKEDYDQKIHQLAVLTVCQTIFFFCSTTLICIFGIDYMLREQPSLREVSRWLVASLLWGIAMFIINKAKIHKDY